MAAARSTLLEGLEDISEEEQLRRVLEMSRYDTNVPSRNNFGHETNNPNTGASRISSDPSFEDWVRIPAEERLQMMSRPAAADSAVSAETAGPSGVRQTMRTSSSVNSDMIYYSDNEDDQDEDIRKAIEASKQITVMSEEEKTNLAIEQSKNEVKNEAVSLEQQLEEAIKLSLGNEYMTANTPVSDTVAAVEMGEQSKRRHISADHIATISSSCSSSSPSSSRSSSPPAQRPASPINPPPKRKTKDNQPSGSLPKNSSGPPGDNPSLGINNFQTLNLSESQQMELALRNSQEEALRNSQEDPFNFNFMSEEEQLKYALRLSRSESEHTFPTSGNRLNSAPVSKSAFQSTPIPTIPKSTSLPRSASFQQNRHYGARPRVTPASSNASISPSNSVSRPVASSSSSSTSTSSQTSGSLRLIVLDGMNICMQLGNGEDFVASGLLKSYEWFSSRGHVVVAILPQGQKSRLMGMKRNADLEILDNLEKSGILCFTPSRKTDEKRWNSYDDRYIVEYAAMHKGIVVSNDQMLDVLKENEEFREQIVKRHLGYGWIGPPGKEVFMPAQDPLGKGGPKLDKFLRF